MLRKILSLVLTLSVLLMPVAAFAEGETLFTRLTVTDPVLTVSGQVIDLTGLQLLLSGAYDLSDTKDPQATITAQVLGDGKEALAGAVAIDKEKVMGMLNGLASEYFIKFSDLEDGFEYTDAYAEVLDQFVDTMGKAIRGETDFSFSSESTADMTELFDESMMVDGGTTEITFGGETKTAQKYTITLSEEDYRELMIAVYGQFGMGDMIAEMLDSMDVRYTGDINFYFIDEYNVKVDFTMVMTMDNEPITVFMDMDITMTEDGENAKCAGTMNVTDGSDDDDKLMGDFTIDVTAPAEDDMDMTMNMTMYPESEPSEVITMNMVMGVHPSDAFEDAYDVKFDVNMTGADEGTEAIRMGFSLTPSAVDGGEKYNYAFTVSDGGETDMGFTGEYVEKDNEFGFTLAMDVTSEGENVKMDFAFGGAYEEIEGGEFGFDGEVSFALNADGEDISFTTKLGLFISPKVEGRMLSEADFTALVDANELTEDELEALMIEVQTVGLSALAVLQQLPGVNALLQSLTAVTDDVA